MEPETRYARLGQHHIAFEVMGDGPIDVVWTVGRVGSMESEWADPEAAAFLERLASFCRLIRYDALGTGSSDPVPLDALPPLEQSVEELLAVMDAAKSERAVLNGHGPGGQVTMLAAATRPERVLGLILSHSPARYLWAEDYPEGVPMETAEAFAHVPEEDVDRFMDMANPSRAKDPAYVRRRQQYIRGVGGPSAWRAYTLEFMRRDVRSLLPAIHLPTLVVHKQDTFIPVALSRYVAEAIPEARFVLLPGADVAPFWESPEVVLETMRDFLSSLGPESFPSPAVARIMATLLFTDIVSSTERLQTRGDSEWVHLLELHDSLSRRLVEEQQGRVVKTTGDGILARFDTPGRGLLSATALRHQLGRIGLPIRAGLHTGEVELRGDDLGGLGVHIAARVMATAEPGEILVSRTVRDLVAGSPFRFEDRGSAELKGIEGAWQLYALAGG
ncbi:MAG TPA: adenylate/guanylate cyclase domain-containing protein [Acidimicrobiia bacterium]